MKTQHTSTSTSTSTSTNTTQPKIHSYTFLCSVIRPYSFDAFERHIEQNGAGTYVESLNDAAGHVMQALAALCEAKRRCGSKVIQKGIDARVKMLTTFLYK